MHLFVSERKSNEGTSFKLELKRSVDGHMPQPARSTAMRIMMAGGTMRMMTRRVFLPPGPSAFSRRSLKDCVASCGLRSRQMTRSIQKLSQSDAEEPVMGQLDMCIFHISPLSLAYRAGPARAEQIAWMVTCANVKMYTCAHRARLPRNAYRL